MTPLPGPLGSGGIVGWRLDRRRFAPSWDSGEGAFRFGARWNSRGIRAVHASIDPAKAILEVAVQKGFRALDMVPHVLTRMDVSEPSAIHVVFPADLPNANWLHPGIPSAGQQQFGDALLAAHRFVIVRSVVSTGSWTIIFDPRPAAGSYRLHEQEDFAPDTRLQPTRTEP